MTNFSDAQVLSATVATTTESSMGTINVPAGRTYTITNLWGAGTGGTYKILVDRVPSMQGNRIQNADTPTNIGPSNKYDENIVVNGPAEISGTITNSAATSTVCKIVVEYVDSGGQG